MTLLGVAVAGALGAASRYALERATTQRHGHAFPWGTLIVNTTGSLAIGLVVGLAMYHGLGAASRSVLGTGFLGGYTTFSTFAVETVRLWEVGTRRSAALYASASFATGLAAAASGLAMAALL